MPSITVKGMSDDLMAALRTRAAGHRRSLNQEIIRVLEDSVRAGASGAAPDWAGFAQQADALRERLREQYGTMSDSTALIREDRDSR